MYLGICLAFVVAFAALGAVTSPPLCWICFASAFSLYHVVKLALKHTRL